MADIKAEYYDLIHTTIRYRWKYARGDAFSDDIATQQARRIAGLIVERGLAKEPALDLAMAELRRTGL